jgi:hypothetical protein
MSSAYWWISRTPRGAPRVLLVIGAALWLSAGCLGEATSRDRPDAQVVAAGGAETGQPGDVANDASDTGESGAAADAPAPESDASKDQSSTCASARSPCGADEDCCGRCQNGRCVDCLSFGASCLYGVDCCSLYCREGACQCLSPGSPCDAYDGRYCCGGACLDGTCS